MENRIYPRLHVIIRFFMISSILLLMGSPVFAQDGGNGQGVPPREPTFGSPSSAALSEALAAVPSWAVADALDISSASILSASWGTSDPLGTTVYAQKITEFPTKGNSFLVISSGNAQYTTWPNTSGNLSTELGGLNNSQGNDLVQLSLTLKVPEGFKYLTVDWKFLSEEYPEFVNSPYNDAFLGETPMSNFTITYNDDVDAPNNKVFDTHNQLVSINTTGAVGMSAANALGTTYDGATTIITTSIPIHPGATQINLIFSVMDAGDSIYDTTVFLDNLRFSTSIVPTLVKRDVVFVQGLTSEGKCGGANTWAKEFLKSSEAQRAFPNIEFDDFINFSYEDAKPGEPPPAHQFFCSENDDGDTPHYSKLDTCDGVEQAAGELRALIDAQDGDKVTILGHSMGGLVAAYMIAVDKTWAEQHIASVITFDSPLRGVGGLQEIVVPAAFGECYLAPSHESLQDVNDDSDVVAEVISEHPEQVVPFYPFNAIDGELYLDPGLEAVPEYNATLPDARAFSSESWCLSNPSRNCDIPRPIKDDHSESWKERFDEMPTGIGDYEKTDKAVLVGCAAGGVTVCEQAITYVYQDTWVETLLSIPSAVSNIKFSIDFHSIVRMTLIAPDGTVYGPYGAGQVYSYAVDDTSEMYVIENPMPGDWTVQLLGVEIDPGGEPVTVSMTAGEPQHAPVFDVPPSPPFGTEFTTETGHRINISVQASDSDEGDVVSVDVINAPAGATFVPVPGNPGSGTFSWRPAEGQEGTYVIFFGAVDDKGTVAEPHPITVVVDPLKGSNVKLRAPKDHTNIADTTPTFKWLRATGAAQYRLDVDDDPAFGSPISQAVTTLRYTFPTPLEYGTYYWRVQAGDGAGNWGDWSYTNTVTVTILNAPKNAKHLTDTTPTLRWKSAGYGALYEVEVDEIGGNFGSPVFTYNGPARSIAATELPGGDYQWHARAYTSSGWSVWTPIWTFTITPPTTTRPPLISPANYARLDTTTPDFEWSAVPNGVIYQIQISAKRNFRTPVQDVMLDPGDLDYTAASLADGGKYFWRVRAINSEGVAGAWSAKWRFTLNQLVRPVPLAPSTGTKTTNTAPDLSWNPVPDAVGYEIQIDTDKKFGTPDQTLTTADTFITPSALPDGKYFWRVRAVNAAGVTGLWSGKWNITVDTTGPDQPVLRSPKDHAGTRDSTPTLVWRSAKTAKQYHVQVAADAAFTQIEAEMTVGARTYTMPSADALDYGTHYWHVQAIDALGNVGGWSTPFQFALSNMTNPKDGATTTALRPTFAWTAVAGASAYHFELADNEDFNAPLTGESSGLARSYVPPLPLTPGVYYWHVNVDGGDWMPTWTLVITPAKPGRPVPFSPANKTLTNDSTPTFEWLEAPNGQTYQIQIDNNRDFSSPEQDVTVGVGLLSYVADELPDGRYFWHVRAFNTDSAPGAWSAKRNFTVDTLAPPVPDLLAPIEGAASTNRMLKLTWTKVDGAKTYELRLDPDPAFPLPVISAGKKTTYKPPTPLSRAIYWWQVRALDKAGNVSDWSAPRQFEIVAGITAPTVEPPTPLPTVPVVEPLIEPTAEPTLEPTGEPTLEPTTTPEPALVTVESDDPAVQRSGNWTSHQTELASGGSYLYSSGSANDTLSLSFTGSRVDVVFVMHPALGSFALVLDEVAVETVNSTASDTVFGKRVSLNVAVGPHTLRIVPVDGVVAIDAFAVEATSEPPVPPTVEPTVEPTIEPTGEPTVEPTSEPTTEPPVPPVPTEEVTATPLPTDVPTETPVPTDVPTETPTEVPTETPLPTATPTEVPTATPLPTVPPTPVPTEVPPPATPEPLSEPPPEPAAVPDNG